MLQVVGYELRAMKVVVGLGNPGEKYKDNRHNVGQMFIDYIRIAHSSQLITQEKNKKLQVVSYKLRATNDELRDVVLVKPQTFMNLSGSPVKKLVTSYGLRATSDLIVVHDDLDIPLGKFKIQYGTGPPLHNGIESIEKALGTKDFWRVRIGVDNRMETGYTDGETYVLQDFRPEEKIIINQLFPQIFKRIKQELLPNI